MTKSFFLPLLLIQCLFSDLHAEYCISREFGFCVQVPGEAIKTNMANSLGPLIGISAANEEKLIIYHVQAHKMKVNEALGKISDEDQKKLVKANFDAYCKEGGAMDVKSKWLTTSAWPVLEFSCYQIGALKEGVKSYKRGYVFLQNSSYFKLLVTGLEDNKDLADAGVGLFASFIMPDDATLKLMEAK